MMRLLTRRAAWVALAGILFTAPAAGAEAPKAEEKPPAAAPAPAAGSGQPAAVPAAAVAPAPAPEATESALPPKPKSAIDEVDDWVDKTTVIAPWLTWGADFRFRDEYTNNNSGLNKHLPGHETNMQKYRPRWWVTVTPAKDADLNLRILWEGRHFSEPHTNPEFDRSTVFIDSLNLKMTNIGGSSVSMTLGRQDIFLGDGWLVSDGTPLDGTRSAFFDALRLSYEIKEVQTLVDAIFINDHYDGDKWLKPLRDDEQPMAEQDERGFIFHATNRSVKNTEINGYYIYKINSRVLTSGDDGHIHTFGGRVAGDLSDRWKYRAEGAHQFGTRNDRNLRAFGFTTGLTYLVKDKWNHRIRGQYEYLSGDDPFTKTNEAFAPLWNRRDSWSKILSNTMTLETRKFEFTNLHRIGPGFTCNPTDRLELSGDYYCLFADENSMTGRKNRISFSDNGLFRGQLLQLQAGYQFTRHIKGRVITEFFFPGNYYTGFRNDAAAFLRGEMMFTW